MSWMCMDCRHGLEDDFAWFVVDSHCRRTTRISGDGGNLVCQLRSEARQEQLGCVVSVHGSWRRKCFRAFSPQPKISSHVVSALTLADNLHDCQGEVRIWWRSRRAI